MSKIIALKICIPSMYQKKKKRLWISFKVKTHLKNQEALIPFNNLQLSQVYILSLRVVLTTQTLNFLNKKCNKSQVKTKGLSHILCRKRLSKYLNIWTLHIGIFLLPMTRAIKILAIQFLFIKNIIFLQFLFVIEEKIFRSLIWRLYSLPFIINRGQYSNTLQLLN